MCTTKHRGPTICVMHTVNLQYLVRSTRYLPYLSQGKQDAIKHGFCYQENSAKLLSISYILYIFTANTVFQISATVIPDS